MAIGLLGVGFDHIVDHYRHRIVIVLLFGRMAKAHCEIAGQHHMVIERLVRLVYSDKLTIPDSGYRTDHDLGWESAIHTSSGHEL